MIDASDKVVKIFVVEEEEIYQHVYELLPSRGPVKLLGVSSTFEVSAVNEVASNYGPEVLVLGTGKLDSEVVEGLQQFRALHPKSGIIVFFSQYNSQDIEALRRLALNGEGGVAVFLKQSLKEIEQMLGIIMSVTRGEYYSRPYFSYLHVWGEAQASVLGTTDTQRAGDSKSALKGWHQFGHSRSPVYRR